MKNDHMVTIREAKKIARNWFDQHREKFNGLIGAYFSGSLSYMDDDDEFPFYWDIDIKLVVENLRSLTRRRNKEKFGSYLVDWTAVDTSNFVSTTTLLEDGYISQDLLVSDIIFEKGEWLSYCQQEIRNSFSDPVFISLRCRKYLQKINNALNDHRYLVIHPLADLVVTANCRRHTIRRLLEETYLIFREQNRPELQELILEVLGSQKFTRQEVLQDLDSLMEAFDYAVELQQRSGLQGNVNIQPFVRSYIYHGTLEMIDRNNYREAVWWLLETYNTVARTIMNHNVTMPNKFISRHMEFLNRLGLLTPDQKSKKEEFSRSAVTKIMHYIEHDLQIPPFT